MSSNCEESKPLDTLEKEEVRCFIGRHFSDEIASKFEAEDMDGDSLIRLLRKPDEDELFQRLGLTTFGKLCKFRNLLESLLPSHARSGSRPSTPSSSQLSMPKPSLSEISSHGKDVQLLYKAKRGCIQRAAVQQWPGNNFPNFRLAEEKSKLDELANSLMDECSIPEINFGVQGIKQHIQSVFNERRRSRKRDKIDYNLPDKRFCLKNVSEETKPALPAMSFGYEDKKDDDDGNGDSDGDQPCSQSFSLKKKPGKRGCDSDYQDSDGDDIDHDGKSSGGDTEILENSSDQEVTAVNLSSKSARVLLLVYSGKTKIDGISRVYLIGLLKELKGKVSLAKHLSFDALCKAVAVKLVNSGYVKLKSKASLSNLKQSDVVLSKKSKHS